MGYRFMDEIRLNGNTVELYSSIDEMPYSRFQEYNRALLIASQTGSTFADIDQRITQARRFNAIEDKENTEKALLNLRQSIFNVLENISPESVAFVALIRTINGKPADISKPDQVIKQLSKKGLTVGKVKGFLNYVKKNWKQSWNNFSRRFQTAA